MKTSENGLRLIEKREGLRTKAYRDTKGIPTIGVGHTGPEVKIGMIWTIQKCRDTLAKDILIAENAVNAVNVPLLQNQFDALVSLTFNIGVGAFKRSTVVKKLKLHDINGAAHAILMWNKPVEIMGRRMTEYKQFKGEL